MKASPDWRWFKSLGLWLKVVLFLVLIEILLFHANLFWHLAPNFAEPNPLRANNWNWVYQTARAIETRRSTDPTVIVIGSSVLQMALDPYRATSELRARNIPVDVLSFSSLGSTTTDTALVAWQSRPIRPWLVVYTGALRDFCKFNITDSAVKRTFYDSSAELPLWPRTDVEAQITARLRRYWKLYRYRYFARRIAVAQGEALLSAIAQPSTADAQPPPRGGYAPPEARRYFDPLYIDGQSWTIWSAWRHDRQFDTYLRYLKSRGADLALNLYKIQTKAACGPEDNPHAKALEWMLDRLQELNSRAVVIWAPENPVFFDTKAMPYYDFQLAIAYLQYLPTAVGRRGAAFDNWRTVLAAEDFYDLIHTNIVGRQKFTDRFVSMVEREWNKSSPTTR